MIEGEGIEDMTISLQDEQKSKKMLQTKKLKSVSDSYDVDEEFDILLLSYPKPTDKPRQSLHGHNEVETPINLRKRKDGMTP